MKTNKTRSAEETQKLGEELARELAIRNRPLAISGATVIALQGDLGAGKTTFTQGFLRGFGIKRRAVSPTFIIMRRYEISRRRRMENGERRTGPHFKNLYHFDAYRLKKAENLEALEFKLILSNPENLILIEWPERIRKILPKGTIWLKFTHGKKENERRIAMK
ncbi:MAG: tRNA (adenosine(37)-N6)-threonylcarbamoyltransferase complex ATPase subunit type 1 TsaE [Patescibacteria group bacterium]|nr:tRNA (adenosine(37)-N6)-threonylcarbamoyltransferase complex ATPase subunit type 1 TsaE [Patescibacteria group bacterium]